MASFKISKTTIILLSVIGILLYFVFAIMHYKNKKLSEINSLYKTSQDSLIQYKNDKGQSVAKISVLETTNQKYFLQLQTNDKTIKELQELVKSESKKRHDIEVALVIKSQTIYKLQDSLRNSIIGQTIEHKGDSIMVYPIYQKDTTSQWLSQRIVLGRKVFKQDLKVFNAYDITIGSEPDGLFKRKQYAQIVNLNPASSTEAMKVYQKKEVSSKFWPFIGGGIAGGVIVILVKLL